MSDRTYNVSLRAFHPAKNAEEIVATIGLKARILQTMGEPGQTPKGTKLKGIHDRTYVSFPLEAMHGEDLEGILRRTLNQQ